MKYEPPYLMSDRFNSSDSDYYTLPDSIYARVSDTINGDTLLTVRYPISGINADYIEINRLISGQMNNWQNRQVYRIFSVAKKMKSGYIELKAEPIANDLRNYILTGIRGTKPMTPDIYWEAIRFEAKPNHATSGWAANSDVYPRPWHWKFWAVGTENRQANVNLTLANGLQALSGVKGSMLDCFGGEIEKNNAQIQLRTRLGGDKGYRIEFGSNLQDVDFRIDTTDTIFSILPYFRETTTDGEEKLYFAPAIDPVVRATGSPAEKLWSAQSVAMDFSDETKVRNDLIPLAQQYFKDHPEVTYPTVNMTVEFVNLQNKKGYEQIQALQNVALGDDVTVYHSGLNIDIKTRIVSTEYDLLTEEYSKLILGNTKNTFLKQMQKEYDQLFDRAFNNNGASIIQQTL